MICDHEVKIDVIEVQRGGNMTEATRTIEDEVLSKALPYLRNVTIANGTVNEAKFKESLKTGKSVRSYNNNNSINTLFWCVNDLQFLI